MHCCAYGSNGLCHLQTMVFVPHHATKQTRPSLHVTLSEMSFFSPDNYVHDNGDAGLALLESFNADVSDNVFEDNKYGIRFSVASANNVFSDNVIRGSTK